MGNRVALLVPINSFCNFVEHEALQSFIFLNKSYMNDCYIIDSLLPKRFSVSSLGTR